MIVFEERARAYYVFSERCKIESERFCMMIQTSDNYPLERLGGMPSQRNLCNGYSELPR